LKFLSVTYPNYQWDPEKFVSKPKKSSQWCLHKVIKDVLPPNIEVLEEYVHPLLHYIETGSPMVFDIYIRALKLAFEYQGHHHFHDHYMFGDVAEKKIRDEDRRHACKSNGITLIEVPYWWHRDKESIIALLHHYRPDIVPVPPGSNGRPSLLVEHDSS